MQNKKKLIAFKVDYSLDNRLSKYLLDEKIKGNSLTKTFFLENLLSDFLDKKGIKLDENR